MNRNRELDLLFGRWIQRYPTGASEFHRDGIIDEQNYEKQEHRLLFVMLEPSSKGVTYKKYLGCDLRVLYREEPLAKSLTKNVGLWTLALLEGDLE